MSIWSHYQSDSLLRSSAPLAETAPQAVFEAGTPSQTSPSPGPATRCAGRPSNCKAVATRTRIQAHPRGRGRAQRTVPPAPPFEPLADFAFACSGRHYFDNHDRETVVSQHIRVPRFPASTDCAADWRVRDGIVRAAWSQEHLCAPPSRSQKEEWHQRWIWNSKACRRTAFTPKYPRDEKDEIRVARADSVTLES
jgi:hypothetical protein